MSIALLSGCLLMCEDTTEIAGTKSEYDFSFSSSEGVFDSDGDGGCDAEGLDIGSDAKTPLVMSSKRRSHQWISGCESSADSQRRGPLGAWC